MAADYCLALCATNISLKLKQRSLETLLKNDFEYFTHANKEHLQKMIETDTDALAQGYNYGRYSQSWATTIAAFVLAFVSGWQLALALLIVFPLVGLVLELTQNLRERAENMPR